MAGVEELAGGKGEGRGGKIGLGGARDEIDADLRVSVAAEAAGEVEGDPGLEGEGGAVGGLKAVGKGRGGAGGRGCGGGDLGRFAASGATDQAGAVEDEAEVAVMQRDAGDDLGGSGSRATEA